MGLHVRRALSMLILLTALVLAQELEKPKLKGVDTSPDKTVEDGTDEETEEGSDAAVAIVTITILVVISILFEMFTEILRESADDMNMPFINTIFSELTTLGFIGLLLFVITKLDVLPTLSLNYLGEAGKLQETIEVLHMGLFLFIIIFLVLCCGLLKFGTFVQSEWREFERSSEDIPAVVSEYVLATEPPRSWREKLSISRILSARKCKREMVYLSLRRRFCDYRSNHPHPETALRLAKEFQRNPGARFPFNEYLSIISGEVMARLIEIDLPTWIALEVFLVSMLVVCWQAGIEGEVWVLLFAGLLLVLMNAYVHTLIRGMRRMLTPPRMLKDAERLRRKNQWRAKHHLPLYDATEKTWILEDHETSEGDFTPPYIDTLPGGGLHMNEHELITAQKALLGGRGNGVKLALFSTRLVFLLTAMHLSVFLMRTVHQIYRRFDNPVIIAVLFVLFSLPSVLVTGMSVMIARDGLYAFNVEHMKVSRIIAKVMRILKARQTLRTLRFVAEMKIYLRENVRRRSSVIGSDGGGSPTAAVLPITAALREASAKYSHTASKRKMSSGVAPPSPKQSLDRARRQSTKLTARPSLTSLQPAPSSPTLTSPPMSPLAAYAREKRSDAYRLEMERREINTIFCLFDVDGSGAVSREEMASLLTAITHDLDETQLNRLVEDLLAGQDSKDEITFEAFYNWCHQHIQESTHSKEELIEEIFSMVDTDNSGYITVDEFIAIFKALGQSLDHDDVRELVYQMDRNDDGKIDLEEFHKMLHKHEV
ncbi:hypothetical protein Poli38472_000018 [Pythium oligandrum]|uniref:EF-hand domain-containing protein n=1 Tax=Pythium oligandrum TaxID=41045 RepID=A0A8K1CAY9_PYTOL|nr:hypothetical protein Poli38472_000018 [Pythium oligandrum]|eukprot:TMW59976.1 hypothetical protein Poli38472_000018 [Pythium oligandrum]